MSKRSEEKLGADTTEAERNSISKAQRHDLIQKGKKKKESPTKIH